VAVTKASKIKEQIAKVLVPVMLLMAAGGFVLVMLQHGTAALEDRWWFVRLCTVCTAAALSQSGLLLAGRAARQEWRRSLLGWQFFGTMRWTPPGRVPLPPKAGQLPPANPPPRRGPVAEYAATGVIPANPSEDDVWSHVETDVAIRLPSGGADRLLVVVRARGHELKHRVRFVAGTMEVVPGGPEDVLGVELAERMREIGARFPLLRGGTEGDALLLEVHDVPMAQAHGDVNMLRVAVRDVVWTLMKRGKLAAEGGGYRGLVQRGSGGVDGDLNPVFEPLDSDSMSARPLAQLADFELGARGGRALFGVAGTALVATGTLVCLGALRVAASTMPYVGFFGSIRKKDPGFAIGLGIVVAAAGICLQAASVSVPPPGGGLTRVQKTAGAIIAIVVICGMGSCIGVGCS